MDRAQLFASLETLYGELTSALPKMEGNPCGNCKACCTAGALTHHQVAELELQLIGARLGESVAQDFRAYLNRTQDDEGKLVFETCPNYDLERRGCGIYSIRPFSCRVFGHHLQEGTRFPDDCVFEGKAPVFPSSQYYQAIPLTNRMRWLTREPIFFTGPRSTNFVTMQETPAPGVPVNFDFLNENDPIDRAIQHQIRGDLSAALAELLQARDEGAPSWGLPGDPRCNYLHYSLAMLFSMQDRHEEAIENYRILAAEVPRADFHYFTGYHYLAMGLNREGEAELLKSIELDPGYSMSLGFLGYLGIMEQRFEDASVYLERAVVADPSNAFFHLRLGTAWLQVGRIADGVAELREALRFEPTRKQAEQMLERFGHAA